MQKQRAGVFLIALALLFAPEFSLRVGQTAENSIILATTTSTRDSGLLDRLLPLFEKKSDYTVKTIAVGTGKALAMAKRGDADAVITHAPEAELPLVDQGWLISRVQFMHNNFVIVGPPSDPAKIAQARKASTALKQIAAAKSAFVSRGDKSGTHQKELSLWREAGAAPGESWYIEAGQGMAATLRIASEKNAYTLSDRATYLSLQKTLACKILLQGDPVLLNKYSVMLVNPAKHARANAKGAKAFHAWLLSDEARALIRDYGKDRFGEPLFFLDSPE